MKAAVVQQLGAPPSYTECPDPVAGAGETVVTVGAAPLSPIVKARAAGTHYTSTIRPPFIAGVDGVGTDGSGRRVYFLLPKPPSGSMAERALVPTAMTVPVPDALSDQQAAAIATAGLASWLAFSRRAPLAAGDTVLVNGATGAAGGMAIQTARHFGARKVIAVGRDAAKLSRLDADIAIPLDDGADAALDEALAGGVSAVLDFLWGPPALRILQAVVRGRLTRRLRFAQLGTIAGDEIAVRGDALRSTGLELVGSGIGSLALTDLVAGAGELLAAAPGAGFRAPFVAMPLREVAAAWTAETDARVLLCP